MEQQFPGDAFARAALQGEYREKFQAFYRLLVEYNAKFNLTALTEEREVWIKHFYDSLAGEYLFPERATCAEIGSGAGFPSLPLCIVRKDLVFTLIESTGKKCDFLEIAAEKLSLPQVKVLRMRAEDGARDESLREKFDVCCARAVARMNTLAEYCLPYVREGGRMIAYKGNDSGELREGERAISLLGGRTERCDRFDLPEGRGSRTLICVRKVKATPAKYPRGRGRERTDPIL